jgi:hypothetical protein
MRDLIAGLLNQRTTAQPEHRLGFLDRHFVLEFRAHKAVRLAFDREVRPRSCPSHTNGYAVSTGKVALTEALTRGVLAPAVTHDKELALDLNGHGMVLDWRSGCTQDN